MNGLIHTVTAWFLRRNISRVKHFTRHPLEVQQQVFDSLIHKARRTEWGKKYGYADIRDLDTYRNRVPVRMYEDLFPWIDRMFQGEANVLWPGRIKWFSKSSGTTNDKSKYIPVSPDSLTHCHFKAGRDMLSMYLHNKPQSRLFTGKSLSIGGTHSRRPEHPDIRFGDVSAVITENLPSLFEFLRTPSKAVAFMDQWEPKLKAMLAEVKNQHVTGMAGVPTWTLMLLHQLLETQGGDNLLDIWPQVELYLHGGVNFNPYRDQFKALIPKPDMSYIDVYNASEGFFAAQSELEARDMLLMLDYGVFFEFMPLEELGQEYPRTISLEEVELGKTYALVISTNGGLWRYNIGDTLSFTSKNPYKIRIAGRTKQFINAFGEELMVDNAEEAITLACRETGALVDNFTAAPIYFQGRERGGHEWLIEFDQPPDSQERFNQILDVTLRQLNSDYEAKRQSDLALGPPSIRVMPAGTFHAWMKKRGKLGGQHKVPRLANHREYVEDILRMGQAKPS